MNFFEFFYRSLRRIYILIFKPFDYLFTYLKFIGNGVNFSTFKTSGQPFVMVARGGKFNILSDFKINNNHRSNPIGRPQKCSFVVDTNAILEIGKNVGLSSVAIVCHRRILISDDVIIGGGTCIYDTDFHSTDPFHRNDNLLDKKNKKSKEIIIKNNVFIGAHCTILKGVIIGQNSIIGACSTVTKNIPDNEIWAGNPAKFIKKLNKYF